MKLFQLVCLFYVLMISWVDVSAQSYQLTTYQTEQGLSANVTKAIVQDKLGFMWIASDEGVSRFDGRKFVNFKKELPSRYTKSIFASREGRLLVVNDMGIVEIKSQPDTSIFKNLIQGATNIGERGKIMYPKEIFEDCSGSLWISEPNSVMRYQNGKMKRYLLPKKMNTTVYLRSFHFTEPNCNQLFLASFKGFLLYYNKRKDFFEELKLPENLNIQDISAITSIDDKTLWLGDGNGIIEIKINQLHQVESAKRIINLKAVSYLKKDAEGNILVGTWNSGLYKIEKNNAKPILQKINESHANVINQILIDKEANVWVCSDDGIELLKPHTFNTLQVNERSPFIESIYLTNENNLLVCDGTYIHQITKKGDFFEKKQIYNYPKSNIHAVAQVGKRLFVGTGDDQIVCFEQGKVKEINLNKFGKTVFSIFADNQQNVWVCQYGREQGVLKLKPDFSTVFYAKDQGIDSLVYVVKEDTKGVIYCGSKGKSTYLYRYDAALDKFSNVSIPISLKSSTEFIVNDLFFDDKEQIWIASNQGLWLMKDRKTMLVDLGKIYANENMTAVWVDKAGNVWIGTNFGVIKYKNEQIVLFEKVNGLSTVTVTQRGILQNNDGNLFFATANGLNYLEEKITETQLTPSPVFLTFKANQLQINPTEKNLIFNFSSNLEIKYLSFSYPNNRVLYQYRILGLQEEWSEPSELNQIIIERVPYGNYQLEIRAKQQGNYAWSKPLTLSFAVNQAWYFTWWATLVYIFTLTFLLWLSVNFNTRRLKQQREKLQIKVTEATKEIALRAEKLREAHDLLYEQKEEIQEQKTSIEAQKETIESAYKIIERNNRKIIDSIRYAKTIQQIILPPESSLKNLFKDYFLIYKPKDMVSGDFYWALKVDNKIFVAVVDCTGHGVPGAFMSMIGYTLLYRIIKLKGLSQPSRILDMLHAEVRVVLKQKENSNVDGMDICLCVLERIENQFETLTKVVFTGARRPLYYFANGSLEILDEDRKSIGGIQNKDKVFQSQAVVLHSGDAIYLSTDGLIDQNNLKRKKFGENQFSKNIEKNAHLPMHEQKQALEQVLEVYQQGSEQRDDITVLGIRL